MTPIKRYQTLSKALFKLRGQNFEIYLQGTDDLIKSLSSVLFEACNTSFQTHLQIDPDEFVDKHNWAQMISGPVLSTATNSPILFGKELWHETRVALFKQSLDTRSSSKYLRQKLPRVYFGTDWIHNSPADLWKNDIMRFPLILTSDDFKLSTEELKSGKIPELRGIRLHNGTTYTWNRMCYGHANDNPHLRIECRYIPAGPSLVDEFANFAFWIGLMSNIDKRGRDFWKTTDFRIAKTNFIKAARTGFNTVFDWFGKNRTAKSLILEELLEQSYEGLMSYGVDETDAKKYLNVIEKRAEKEITGSQWIIDNYRSLNRKCGEVSAQKSIIKRSLEYQDNNVPLHEWANIKSNLYLINQEEERVEEFMSKDIYSVKQNDSIDIARKILQWNDIHHVPVEDDEGDLVGMITDGIIKRVDSMQEKNLLFASQIMIVNPVTVHATDSLSTAKEMMEEHNISGLPVVFDHKLVGIITTHDCDNESC
jgi:CBS domain-containing protein